MHVVARNLNSISSIKIMQCKTCVPQKNIFLTNPGAEQDFLKNEAIRTFANI